MFADIYGVGSLAQLGLAKDCSGNGADLTAEVVSTRATSLRYVVSG
jgi:hypothetical protein